jgi:hypothetical protein
MDFMLYHSPPAWVFYLGTPSGNFYKWSHTAGLEALQ